MRRLLLLVFLAACRRPAAEMLDGSAPSEPPATASAAPTAATRTAGAEPWNPLAIDWRPFDEGLALAKAQKKPVCLVLYTTWCPHCRNYSRVFDDPRLVARAKDFVMIRLDADENDAIARRYRPDGGYVPRTFILDADGKIDGAAVSDNPRYKHFFDEHRAESLLRAMNGALAARGT